jgi:hypothetical protein
MALKAKLETLEGIPETLLPEYKELVEEGTGKKSYVLDVEGAFLHEEDIGPLKRARDYEKTARQNAEKLLKDLNLQVETSRNEIDEMRRGNIPKGDVDKLEKSWKEKLEKLESLSKSELTARDGTITQLLVDNVATSMANTISNSPDLMLPHIKSRLTTELQDGHFVTRVLDREGKPTALSIEELQKDITADKRFAPIIISTKASGGGASGGGKKDATNGSSAPTPFDPKKFDPNKASPKDLVAYQKYKKGLAAGE